VSHKQMEHLSRKIATILTEAGARISELLARAHLTPDDERKIRQRAAEILRERLEQRTALLRVARASGAPDDASVMDWLQQRGLLIKCGGRGWKLREAGPDCKGGRFIPEDLFYDEPLPGVSMSELRRQLER
jgi:hypothetical protein